MTKTGFTEPLKPRKSPDIKPESKDNSIWNFAHPTYDNRSGSFICAGDNYGVGFNVPVGSKKGSTGETRVPMGRVDTLKTDE